MSSDTDDDDPALGTQRSVNDSQNVRSPESLSPYSSSHGSFGVPNDSILFAFSSYSPRCSSSPRVFFSVLQSSAWFSGARLYHNPSDSPADEIMVVDNSGNRLFWSERRGVLSLPDALEITLNGSVYRVGQIKLLREQQADEGRRLKAVSSYNSSWKRDGDQSHILFSFSGQTLSAYPHVLVPDLGTNTWTAICEVHPPKQCCVVGIKDLFLELTAPPVQPTLTQVTSNQTVLNVDSETQSPTSRL